MTVPGGGSSETGSHHFQGRGLQDDSTAPSQWMSDRSDVSSINEKGHDIHQETAAISEPRRPSLAREQTVASFAAAPFAGPADIDIGPSSSGAHHESRTEEDEKALSHSSHFRRPSSASTLQPDAAQGASASRVSTDAYGNTYPEGGFAAWMCVAGSFCGLMSALGMMNVSNIYRPYRERVLTMHIDHWHISSLSF
jgi:hypothetical protein